MLPVAPDDDVIQLYTSGTTGHPKGVQLTSANYLAIIKSATDMGLATYTPEDVVLIAMPIFHVAGVNIGVLTLAHGARGIVLGDIDPQEILSLIETKRINHAFLVPAVILFLTQQPNVRQTDFSSFKIISYGASPIAEDLLLARERDHGLRFPSGVRPHRNHGRRHRAAARRITIRRAASCAPAASPRPAMRSGLWIVRAAACRRARSARSSSARPTS